MRLATLAKQAGVERFVYMSSCSVYGVADGAVDETSADQPADRLRRLQGRCVERDVAALADDDFSPTFMRNATAFGASPRMRFDIVLNNLVGLAWTTKRDRHDERRLAVAPARPRPRHRQGHPLRPRGAPRDGPRRGLQRRQRRRRTTRCATSPRRSPPPSRAAPPASASSGADNRSYQVDFAKISDELPGLLLRLGRRQGRAAARGGLQQHRPRPRDVHRPRPHPAQAAGAPAAAPSRSTRSCSGRLP